MITLTTEQAQQIEDALDTAYGLALSGRSEHKYATALATIRAARSQTEGSEERFWVSDANMPSFQAWLNLFVESRIMEDRAARAQEQLETPFQIGQRLAREGQGISAIWGAVERDSDMDECVRGMRSVWNADSYVAEQADQKSNLQ